MFEGLYCGDAHLCEVVCRTLHLKGYRDAALYAAQGVLRALGPGGDHTSALRELFAELPCPAAECAAACEHCGCPAAAVEIARRAQAGSTGNGCSAAGAAAAAAPPADKRTAEEGDPRFDWSSSDGEEDRSGHTWLDEGGVKEGAQLFAEMAPEQHQRGRQLLQEALCSALADSHWAVALHAVCHLVVGRSDLTETWVPVLDAIRDSPRESKLAWREWLNTPRCIELGTQTHLCPGASATDFRREGHRNAHGQEGHGWEVLRPAMQAAGRWDPRLRDRPPGTPAVVLAPARPSKKSEMREWAWVAVPQVGGPVEVPRCALSDGLEDPYAEGYETRGTRVVITADPKVLLNTVDTTGRRGSLRTAAAANNAGVVHDVDREGGAAVQGQWIRVLLNGTRDVVEVPRMYLRLVHDNVGDFVAVLLTLLEEPDNEALLVELVHKQVRLSEAQIGTLRRILRHLGREVPLALSPWLEASDDDGPPRSREEQDWGREEQDWGDWT